MIDTIRLEIRGLDPAQIAHISRKLDTLYRVSNGDGQVVYAITSGQLLGSWDYRVRLVLRDYDYISVERDEPVSRIGRHVITRSVKRTVRVDVEPYLLIEFSLSKFLYGHNLLNSSLVGDYLGLYEFRRWLCIILGIDLPSLRSWRVTRLDVARNYRCLCSDHALHTIRVFSGLNYPRRKRPAVYDTSVRWGSSYCAVKVYHKGSEFKKHDAKRLVQFLDDDRLDFLRSYADEIVRFEVEFRKRKLNSLGIDTLGDLLDSGIDWSDEMDAQIVKITGGARKSSVYSIDDAVRIIKNGIYPGCGLTFDSALAVWITISTRGTTAANKIYGRKKVWRARKFFDRIGLACISNLHELEMEEYSAIDLIGEGVSHTSDDAKIIQMFSYRLDTSEYYSRFFLASRARAAA